MHLNPSKTGMAVGGFVAVVHIAWSVVVALNWGQALVDFVTGLHMVHVAVTVEKFDISKAIFLIIMAAIVGYAIGFVFATISNKVYHR